MFYICFEYVIEKKDEKKEDIVVEGEGEFFVVLFEVFGVIFVVGLFVFFIVVGVFGMDIEGDVDMSDVVVEVGVFDGGV